MATVSKVVIVGGGVAGLVLATSLCRGRSAHAQPDVVLVDRAFAHVWKPMLHTFAAGTRDAAHEHVPFLAHAARCGFRFVPGELASIDRASRIVRVAPVVSAEGEEVVPARELAYDTLVLATGSRANDFGTPGVLEHCHFIDDLAQAERFNRSFYQRLLRSAGQGRALDVAVVGGGATGVELAAELTQWMELAAAYNAGPLKPRVRIVLLESGPRLLAAFPEAVATAAASQLQALGVEVRLGTRVVSADPQGFLLASGERIPAQLRVWAAGVRGTAQVAAAAGLELNRSGQVVVRPTLQAAGDPRIFALGDCASLAAADGVLPPTAQVARQQALHLARSLLAATGGRELPAFRFRNFGSLVSLARYNAYGTLGRRGLLRGRFVQGQLARLAHAFLYALHQAQLHGAGRAAVLWCSAWLARVARPRIRVVP